MRALRATLFGLAAVLLAWSAFVALAAPPPYMLPAPSRVAEVLWTRAGFLLANGWLTLVETLLGRFLAARAGEETFHQFCARHDDAALDAMLSERPA